LVRSFFLSRFFCFYQLLRSLNLLTVLLCGRLS
jgi:hypothetical protein